MLQSMGLQRVEYYCALLVAVLCHEQMGHNVPGIIYHGSFARHFGNLVNNLVNVIRLHCVLEFFAERQRFSLHVHQKYFILGKVFQRPGFARTRFPID